MLRRYGLPVVLLLCLSAHAAGAYGASPSPSPSDPPAGSPSGAVYELPFEKGRADAAPKGSGGTSAEVVGAPGGGSRGDENGGSGGGSEGAGGDSSLYRSENNFGSSSHVPGDHSGGGDPGADDREGSAAGAPVAGGAGAPDNGVADAAEMRRVANVTDAGNTSPAANIALLLAIGLVAVAVGAVVVRANRLRAR